MTKPATPGGLTIGFSFWGFLGAGVLDTPDGGRFWRRPIVDTLQALGHRVVMLQTNRDQGEAGQALPYAWYTEGFPPLDILLAEWRWPLPGRNTTPCGSPGHTCDLHRQADLLARYTQAGTPTILWDTDRRLPPNDILRSYRHVLVCEPAIKPTPGAITLVHPVPDAALDTADPHALAVRQRVLPLVYIGNQYDRDDEFGTYFAPAAARFRHRVAGKWPSTDAWPHVSFTGRIHFRDIPALYETALTTVLLLPSRYAAVGHQTQRLFEAVLSGCLPLTPTPIPEAAAFTPKVLHVADGSQVTERIAWACRIARTPEHADVLAACLAALELFRLSTWADRLVSLMTTLTHRARP
jgi:hypothetical protein